MINPLQTPSAAGSTLPAARETLDELRIMLLRETTSVKQGGTHLPASP